MRTILENLIEPYKHRTHDMAGGQWQRLTGAKAMGMIILWDLWCGLKSNRHRTPYRARDFQSDRLDDAAESMPKVTALLFQTRPGMRWPGPVSPMAFYLNKHDRDSLGSTPDSSR